MDRVKLCHRCANFPETLFPPQTLRSNVNLLQIADYMLNIMSQISAENGHYRLQNIFVATDTGIWRKTSKPDCLATFQSQYQVKCRWAFTPIWAVSRKVDIIFKFSSCKYYLLKIRRDSLKYKYCLLYVSGSHYSSVWKFQSNSFASQGFDINLASISFSSCRCVRETL